MANTGAMDVRSPMLQPDEQWTRHSPLLSELDSFCTDGFSSRAAALVTNSDLDALIAELDSSIVEYDARHCIAPLLHANYRSERLIADGADGLAALVCQPERQRSPELRPVHAPAGPPAPTVSTAGRDHDPREPIGSSRMPTAFTVWSASTARSSHSRSSRSEATEAPARHSPASAPPRRTAAPSAYRVRSVSQERERTRDVHDRGHSRDGRGRPRKKYRNKEAHARNLLIGSPNSSFAESSAQRVEAFQSSHHRHARGDGRCRREHNGADDSDPRDRRRRGYRRRSENGEPDCIVPDLRSDLRSSKPALVSYGIGCNDGSPGRQAPEQRACVSFRHGQELERFFPTTSGRRELRPLSRPVDPPVLKAVPMYSPQVQREPAWELLRTSILAAEDAKSTSDRMRVLSKYRKTTAAMVHDMDILLEELMSNAAARTAAPPVALTIQQLQAFMADSKPGVRRVVIDTGAQRSIGGTAIPLGDITAANAMITGASSKVPVAATRLGNATVVSGTANAPVHLSCVGMHIVDSIPPDLMLVSYSELRRLGWRLMDKPGDDIILWSPMTVDGKRRRLELTLEHELLTVKDISSVVPGIVPQPSWLENTAVYTFDVRESMQPVECPPLPALHAFAVYSTSYADSIPEHPAADAGAAPEQCVVQRPDAAQLTAADFPAIPEPIKMSACDVNRFPVRTVPKPPAIGPTVAAPTPAVMSAPAEIPEPNETSTYDVNEVPVRSVPSSAGAIEARVLRNGISPTEIASTGTYPECMITPNTAERFLPVSNVAVAPVHPSHSGNFRLLVRLLNAPDDPNECATSQASCCIPQRVRHCVTPEVAPIPVSLMDTSVPPGPPAMEATVHEEPSARNVSAAAIAFADPDFADEAVADVQSVDSNKPASFLSAMDQVLAMIESGPAAAATVLQALAPVSPLDETTISPPAATVTAVHEFKSNPVPTSYVNCSTTIGHAMCNDDRPVCHADPPAPAPAVDMLQRPGQDENADDDRSIVVKPSKRFRPNVQRFAPTLPDRADAGITKSMAVDAAVIDSVPNSVPSPVPDAHGDDVTIDGGVKSSSVTVFAADPDPTVTDTVRDSYHAAPCNLQSGFDMLPSTAPSVHACFVTGLECPNMPSGVILDDRLASPCELVKSAPCTRVWRRLA